MSICNRGATMMTLVIKTLVKTKPTYGNFRVRFSSSCNGAFAGGQTLAPIPTVLIKIRFYVGQPRAHSYTEFLTQIYATLILSFLIG